jgi:MATE family multidrug resistance protein
MGSASDAAESNTSEQLQSPLLTSLQPAPACSGSGGDDGDGHGAGKQLESILSDESVPWGRRMCAATAAELRMLVRLAAPAVLVYMINYLMSMSTQIFSGQLGTLELAAASLGNTGIQSFAYGLMVSSD